MLLVRFDGFCKNVLKEWRYKYTVFLMVSMNKYQGTDVSYLFIWIPSYASQFSA
jgi:hypothetical protein